MPLTVNKVNLKVCRRLRYNPATGLPPGMSILDICNDAGEWLTGIREWSHLQREPLTLDITAGQKFINLPADLSSIQDIIITENGPWLSHASLADVERSRIGTSDSPGGHWWALVTPASIVTGLVKTPRLEIGPIPTETLAGAFSMIYLAGWVKVSNDADHIVVPAWLESAYIETCVAYAAGAEQESGGTVAVRLTRDVMPLVEMAALRDGTLDGAPLELGLGAAGDYMDGYGSFPGRFQDPTGPVN